MFTSEVMRAIQLVADKNDLESAALEAVCDVESAGVAFWDVDGKKVPPARPEGHYFYRYLDGDKRAEAVRQGLANPKAGALRVPANRAAVYARIARMKAIDETAALQSCSWGLGQVMGANWRSLGYASVQELVAACDTVEGQVNLMVRYMRVNSLLDEIKRHDWKGFAKGYNGAGYARGGYDRKIAQAYAAYKKHGPLAAPLATEAEKQIKKAGYVSVQEFQADKGLVPDGEVGVETRKAAEKAAKEADTSAGDAAVKTGIATGGLDAAIDKINDSTGALHGITDSSVVTWVLSALTLTTVGLILYGLWKKFKGK